MEKKDVKGDDSRKFDTIRDYVGALMLSPDYIHKTEIIILLV